MITHSFNSSLFRVLALFLVALISPVISRAQSGQKPVQQVIVDSAVFNFEDQESEHQKQPASETDTDSVDVATFLADSIVFRAVSDTTLEKLKSSKEFEYANDPEYWVKKKKESDFSFFAWLFSNPGVAVAMYILLAMIVLFVIYKIIVNNNLFYNNSKKIARKTEDIVDVDEYNNLDEKIQTAINQKEFRKAVRYMYVKTLQQLDAKGWIRLHAKSTNHDYITQMSSYQLSGDFNFLTQVYEYVWYGEFNLTEAQFGSVQSNFSKMFKATA